MSFTVQPTSSWMQTSRRASSECKKSTTPMYVCMCVFVNVFTTELQQGRQEACGKIRMMLCEGRLVVAQLHAMTQRQAGRSAA